MHPVHRCFAHGSTLCIDALHSLAQRVRSYSDVLQNGQALHKDQVCKHALHKGSSLCTRLRSCTDALHKNQVLHKCFAEGSGFAQMFCTTDPFQKVRSGLGSAGQEFLGSMHGKYLGSMQIHHLQFMNESDSLSLGQSLGLAPAIARTWGSWKGWKGYKALHFADSKGLPPLPTGAIQRWRKGSRMQGFTCLLPPLFCSPFLHAAVRGSRKLSAMPLFMELHQH